MDLKRTKGVFITIIVLLAIFVSMGLSGMVIRFLNPDIVKEKPKEEMENPNHDFKHNGSLYFYDESDQLIGTYQCNNEKGYCGYAYETFDDEEYGFEAYNDGKIDKIPVISERFAFLVDTSESYNEKSKTQLFLYDIKGGRKISNYNNVKNYTIGIENNYFFVKNTNNKWGVIQLTKNEYKSVMSFIYDFIGLLNEKTDDGVLSTERMAISRESLWSIIGSDQTTYASSIKAPIITFDGKRIVTREDGKYHLIDYEGQPLMEGDFKHISLTGKYANLTTMDNKFYVYNIDAKNTISKVYTLNEKDKVETEIQSGYYVIKINGQEVDKIEI